MDTSGATPAAVAAPSARRASWAGALRKRVGWIVVALCAVAGVLVWRYEATRPPPPTQYRTGALAKRDIVGKVSATGTLSALVTVQVGTQVTGRIQKLFVDFNSKVTQGQVVAKIDPQIYQANADQAQANYMAAQAALAKAQSDAHIAELQFNRTKSLHDSNLASQADLDNAAASVESTRALVDAAKASLAQARAALNQARVNLSYTNIVSPIDGVVISRTVDVGQTVAASLQAPTLFTIAQDLTKMQVDTSVAEADVGRLQVGMATWFTVDAFPGQRFKGKIREIRNAATMVQNVVTYDAVIDVDNTDLRLRPGMTANVTVVYADRPGALAVPNAALRFHMEGEQKGARGSSSAHRGHGKGGGDDAPDGQTIWLMRGGAPQAVTVHLGLTDGTVTEVVDGDAREGDAVVLEAVEPGSAAPSGASTSLRRLF
jgi:HlyD family secretion protein